MYKIGEFAKITNLSIRTLRYYNDIGILVPEQVDIYTNYRYYSEENVNQAKIINLLKDAGFSLEEIQTNYGNFTDEMFLKHKEKLYLENNLIQKQIKLTDQLRQQVKNGQIYLQKIEDKKIKKIGDKKWKKIL